ncbi:Uma2 family endonuclease [Nocardioides eburneus]|uniref:Uma2 family endonuclease n=1 Tax=Nocardioides eburneus TaxID=3231482 RepID=UPI00349F4EEC
METLQHLRMSWEEYLQLPEKPKAEWVDGEVVVSPPVGQPHGVSTLRLGARLLECLPGLVVMTEVGVRLPRNRVRAPDLMVVEHRTDERFVTDPPVLVVEVLSPSTRSEDTIRKSMEYAAGGVGQYWILDPELRALDIHANRDGAWQPLLHLDEARPIGEVTVAGHVVSLDLGDVLGTVA